MVKVRPSTTAHSDNGVGLTGAQNEFVSFQVVVNGNDTGAKGVRATFPGLTDAAGHTIGGTDISLYREAYINIYQTPFPDSSTGPWPDALIPDVDELTGETRSAFPFDVPAQQAHAVWVDVHIPATATPGVYAGNVVVTSSDGLNVPVKVTLTVANFAMSSTASLSSAILCNAGMMCLAETGDSSCGGNTALEHTLAARWEQMALEHRFTCVDLFVPPSPGGDWSGFDALAGPFMDGTSAARLPGAKATTLMYMGSVSSSGYADFQSHITAKGWMDRAFDYTGDEPPNGTSFSTIASRANLVKQNAPSLKTMVTTDISNASSGGILPSLDIMTPVVNFMDNEYSGDSRSTYNSFLTNPNHRLWMYQSCMSQGCGSGSSMPENTATAGWPSYMIEVPAGRNRAMQWADFLEQMNGELYYEANLSLPSAWTNQYQFNGNGDGNLFYPGTSSTIGGQSPVPVASIRMKMIRLGMQDFEWLKKVSDQGDPAFARSVVTTLVPTAYQTPDDGPAYDRAKLQLVARFNQLTNQTAAIQVQGAPPTAPASNLSAAIHSGTDPVTTYVAPPPGTPSPGSSGSGTGSGSGQPLGSGKTGVTGHMGCSAAPVEELALPLLAVGAALVLRRRKRAAR